MNNILSDVSCIRKKLVYIKDWTGARRNWFTTTLKKNIEGIIRHPHIYMHQILQIK